MASGVEVTLPEDVPEIIEEVERELGAGGRNWKETHISSY